MAAQGDESLGAGNPEDKEALGSEHGKNRSERTRTEQPVDQLILCLLKLSGHLSRLCAF